ncbi:hypothetical protein DOTSEDRAFT_72003 [Dothistroma septosporum NZE10]|uniref:Uncharacterized protein n=1 Tax=Dothistroma septosporum (strain NZE10 / CBS 128990) TaxID=675120 RepID=N1PLY1_DOTSN|nr:hypothetical protein DOTSEDRAFT_72003 [Dothistroma septosporum NZE10]
MRTCSFAGRSEKRWKREIIVRALKRRDEVCFPDGELLAFLSLSWNSAGLGVSFQLFDGAAMVRRELSSAATTDFDQSAFDVATFVVTGSLAEEVAQLAIRLSVECR